MSGEASEIKSNEGNPGQTGSAEGTSFDATAITRPDDSLLVYYFIIAMLTTVAFPFVFIPLYIRFKTMTYRFDQKGVSMSWGYFFRHEVYLTYSRLQDIHVTRNILERWMGLAKVPIQTASGASGATMKIEGIRDPDPLRDFLYVRMRDVNIDVDGADSPETDNRGTQLLKQIRDELVSQRIAREENR